MTEHIRIKQQDGILEILFARPDKKNALTNVCVRQSHLEALTPSGKDRVHVI